MGAGVRRFLALPESLIMSTVLAFDLSLTSSGFALGVDGKITRSGTMAGKGESVARLIYNRDAICRQIDSAVPDLVVFEDFSFASNMSSAREISGMAYMIRAELYSDGRPYACVSPLALKKYCVGSAGSAKNKVKKEHILLNVFKRWNHSCESNDEADALVLAHIGMALMGEELPTMTAQSEVLAKLRASNPWLAKLATPLVEKVSGGEW